MKRSMPRISASPATGTWPTADSVAASTMKPLPVTPAAPFDVSSSTASSVSCCVERHRRVGRLRDEHRGHRQVDRRAVEVERVAGRNDQADRRLLHAEVLELRHHPRQHRLRRRRAEHDQQLLLDVADELAGWRSRATRAISAEHDEDEDEARQVEGAHQLAERQQRADAVLADRERHRAERADRRDLHDDADDREQHVRRLLDEVEHERAAAAELVQREAEQHREQQHLQDLALARTRRRRCRE